MTRREDQDRPGARFIPADQSVAAHRRLVKHDAGWTIRRIDDGSIEWTSPLGRVYTVATTTYPVDTTFDSVVPDDNNEKPPASTVLTTPVDSLVVVPCVCGACGRHACGETAQPANYLDASDAA
jgi:hypothetical protein